eukprot:g19695.t1
MQDMGEWILTDPTATNMEERAQYVAAAGETGLFDHASEQYSFQIMTPTRTIRLSHGRLHQLAMRDPTDRPDLPEHLTWQMNAGTGKDRKRCRLAFPFSPATCSASEGMRISGGSGGRRRTSSGSSESGNLGPVAVGSKAREGQRETESLEGGGESVGGSRSSALDLAELLEKKDLSAAEVMVIRQSMVQTQDRLFVATNANEGVGSGGGAMATGRKISASSAAAMEEVVGDDSMVVGKGIMIKGDVDNCATLIVEGYFEGNYRGGFLAVPKGGKYVGMADVRRADIGGRLHGTLSARTLLEVRSSGKIEGMVRYNDVKLEQGGSMVGDIQKGTKMSLGSM